MQPEKRVLINPAFSVQTSAAICCLRDRIMVISIEVMMESYMFAGAGRHTLAARLVGERSPPLPSIIACQDGMWDMRTKYFTARLNHIVVDDPSKVEPVDDSCDDCEVSSRLLVTTRDLKTIAFLWCVECIL